MSDNPFLNQVSDFVVGSVTESSICPCVEVPTLMHTAFSPLH